MLGFGLIEVAYKLHRYKIDKFFWHLYRYNEAITVDFAQAFTSLGPIFIKFGQFLSTRVDIFGAENAKNLSLLQDQVPAFASEQARKIIERALKRKLTEVFLAFEDQPLASASIAQVHAAILHNQEAVVVKVLRPKILAKLKKDLKLLRFLARISQAIKFFRQFKLPALVQEFQKSIFLELDLRQEAANAASLKYNFKEDKDLYIPKVYWDLLADNVLVLERVYGEKISDLELLTRKADCKILAEKIVLTFFTQVFRDSFFHADMHPGNLLVTKSNTIISLDFGIMGSLSPEDQYYIAANLLAFFTKDYYKVASLHVESGWLLAGVNLNDFAAAVRKVAEPILGKTLQEISLGGLILNLLDTAREFGVQIQPQLLLLQKTLVNIEAIARILDPNINIFNIAKPCLEVYLEQKFGLRAILAELKAKVLSALVPKRIEPSIKSPPYNYMALCLGIVLGLSIILFKEYGKWLVSFVIS